MTLVLSHEPNIPLAINARGHVIHGINNPLHQP